MNTERRTDRGELGHCHLVGVAGVGMSALAQALMAGGWAVSGSDRFMDQGRDLEVLRKLQLGGVRLVPQNGSGIGPETRRVVVSTAIEADNPDISAAQRLGVPVIHRSEMLASLVRDRTCVAVTGTAGKTTVTGMIGWIMEQLGADPTVVNGGAVLNWVSDSAVGNFRAGRSGIWVIEADESDRSLLRFEPDWAVITNISRDHFDPADTEALFREFRRKVRRGAVGVLDDGEGGEERRVTLRDNDVSFDYRGISFEVPLLGEHNAENAWHAVRLCERMGCDLERIRPALASFGGIQRRLEVVGRVRGVTVIDDYAHNPAKISAAWRTVKGHHRRVIGVWRPHGFAPLANMMDDLIHALAEACRPPDQVYIMPVFYAGGRAARAVTPEMLVARLKEHGVPAELAQDYDRLEAFLSREAAGGDAILFMGARDPDLPLSARRVARRLGAAGD
jgi:UDP-N-acetylmuramate--alanine ligase